MKLVLMAGGKGERLLPLTKNTPKPMVKILGKPMIEYAIDWAKQYGIKGIIITTCYLPRVFEAYLGDGRKFGVNIEYFTENEPLGTGGSLAFLKDKIDRDFIVLYSDIICKVDAKKLIKFHKKNNADATIVVHDSSHPHDSDLIEFDATGKVKKFWLKPHSEAPTSKSVAGLYVLSRSALKHIPKGKFSLERQLLPLLHEKGLHVYCYETSDFLMDAGTFERLKKVEKILSKED